MNFYSDSSEWRYLLRNAIDWDQILPLYEPEKNSGLHFETREELLAFYEELLTTTGKWTAETLQLRANELDQLGSGQVVDGAVQLSEPLKKTYREAKDLDLFGIGVDPKYGGMGLPVCLGSIIFAQLCRACVSTSTQLGFFACIADMIERFCDSETQEKYIPLIARGEISGSMCMTEPDAGSDVGSLRMTAEAQSDGTYLLNGTKCFITNGGGGLGFILARIIGAPQGLSGISMFFAEEWLPTESGNRKKNYRITKLEEKMGMHGSMTCEIVYENTIARLVGRENEGFKIMLHLMNEARISVGMQGLGGMEAALDLARTYADTRKQFGKPISELPLMKRNLQDWETERDAFRALMVDTISYFDIYQRLHLKKMHLGGLEEKESDLFKKANRVVRARTPLVKYYGSEANALISQRAVQVFGGYGFMKEYGIERLHRDSFGALLYEGTSQIQALMAMKDFLKKMISKPKKWIQELIVEHPLGTWMQGSSYQHSLAQVNHEFRKNVSLLVLRCMKPDLDFSGKSVKNLAVQMGQVLSQEYWSSAERFDSIMIHAETLCQALAYLETLKVLAKHAEKNTERGPLYDRYLHLVTPRLIGIYADWKEHSFKIH